MFVDEARIAMRAGSGGAGAVSFRHEKYIPFGGPDGGDGGRGGSVVLRADASQRTLVEFRTRRRISAQDGKPGAGGRKSGARGEDVLVLVPVGTVIRDAATGEVLADLDGDGEEFVACRGGRGGRGNARFKSSTHRAPRFAERGEPGEERIVELELRLVADVGLVGHPNAGKSTLLARMTAARPKVAAYPFTTLEPQLGVAERHGTRFVVADVPGLVEGAHVGVGLGLEFLRHVRRTGVLVLVVDAAGVDGRDPVDDVRVVLRELVVYDADLLLRPMALVANKMDLPEARAAVSRLEEEMRPRGVPVFLVSAVTGEGVDALLDHLALQVAHLPRSAAAKTLQVLRPDGALRYVVERREDGAFVVRGRVVERMVRMADLDNPEARDFLVYRMKRIGVFRALQRAGARSGDQIVVAGVTLPIEW